MIRSSLAMLALVAGAGAAARDMSPRDVDALPQTPPTATVAYGADPLEAGDLRLPAGKGPFPVAVVIHGGCWTKGFATRRNLAPIASALPAKGIATWNIEYRQLGEPGAGWPGTFRDWGAATDYLRVLARKYPLDLSRVVVLGHSAGAHAALWVASRPRLPATSEIRGARPLPIKAVVAIDGPGDLKPWIGLDVEVCGKPVMVPLIGGTPAAVPVHFREASPAEQLPFRIPQYLVPGGLMTPERFAPYVAAAKAKRDSVYLAPLAAGADHFNIIAPGEPQYATTEATILRAFGR